MFQRRSTERTEIPLNPIDNNEYWRNIFNKYDTNQNGLINLQEFRNMLDSREYENDIPEYVIKKIYQRADENGDGELDFEEFYKMITYPENKYLFGHYVKRYINTVVPRRIDKNRTEPDAQYEDEYSCYPPTIGMIIISIVEIIFFLIDEIKSTNSTITASGPTAKIFIYDPKLRYEVWRFLTYMFVHIGYFHLVVNLLVQILLGIPLEMVHKWWRVLIIYFAGVVAGSLFTSITDPHVKLAGASGGVYALITAHIATIILNWKEMSYPAMQLLIFLIVTATDVGQAIYNRYALDIEDNIGYSAHFAGAVAGLLVGINVLRNLEVTKTEKIIWWGSMITYTVLMLIMILWNVFWPSYFEYSNQHMTKP